MRQHFWRRLYPAIALAEEGNTDKEFSRLLYIVSGVIFGVVATS
jgi:hypothetical protein